jgi:dihydrofolate reductase
MRKVIFQMMVSVDGFFEGPKKEIDWHVVDKEYNDYAAGFLNNVDLLLFGRVTYELMAGYWPSKDAVSNDPVIAERMNNLPKVVFSRTLKEAGWNNTRLVRDNPEEEVQKLKRERGMDIAVLGSSNLALSLVSHGLIDEYRIIINPVALGSGNSLFKGLGQRLGLRLKKIKEFKSGDVLLTYVPQKIGE